MYNRILNMFMQTTLDTLKDIYEVTYFTDKTTNQNIFSTFIDELNEDLYNQV